MSDRKEIISYFKKSEPFKELYLNSDVISKWYGSVFKETDSTWTIKFIHKLGIEIYQNLIGREFDESTEMYQVFTIINEYFKKSIEDSSEPIYRVLVEFWLILTIIVKRNESMRSDKNVSVTFKEVENIRNISLLIRFHLDTYSM